MKILAINWQDLSNPQAGGAEVHLEEILKRMVHKGHSVTLFCSSYPDAKEEEYINGIRVIRKGSRFNFNFVVPLALKSLLAQEQWDVLIEDINKIPFFSPWFQKLPTLVIVPHLFSDTVFKEINFVLGLYIYLAEKPIPRVYKQKKFMVISESTKEDMVKRGIAAENIFVVKCGIDQTRFRFDSPVPKEKYPLALYMGRLKKYKSIDQIIKAFPIVLQKLADAKLVIVGDGDYASELKSLVKKLNLEEKIKFTGYVSEKEKVEWLQKAHLAIYPSLKEGWGLTNIEANACGTPVIASNVPGLKDSVVDGETGFLFEYGNINELAEKIVKVLSDEKLREKLSLGGLKWASSFSWEKAAEETLAILELVQKEGKN